MTFKAPIVLISGERQFAATPGLASIQEQTRGLVLEREAPASPLDFSREGRRGRRRSGAKRALRRSISKSHALFKRLAMF
jgi:hypothetical protein